MVQKIRYGMVGGGEGAFIGDVHRKAAALDGDYELVCGAFSGNPDKSTRSGKTLGISENRCYQDFASMIQEEAELPAQQRMQCVVIVTPNHLHFPVAGAALKNGFHVMSDKPATFSLAECKELAELINESGLLYGLTHTYTGYPIVYEARNLIKDGQLGNIRKIIVEYIQGWLTSAIEQEGQKQAGWRLDPGQAGVSCCMGDIGVHAFNLAEFVTGLQVDSVSAELNRIVPGRVLDDDGTVLLKFNNRASGVLISSQICTGEENCLRLRIYGDKAGLEWNQMEPNTLWIKHADRPAEMVRAGTAYLGTDALAQTRLPAGHPEGYIEAFANLYRNFAEQIHNHMNGDKIDKTSVPGITEALRGMAFIETVVASSNNNNEWLSMPEF